VKFLITMNMPARSGVPIHQIIAEHPATSVEEFADALADHDFIVVEEFYRDADVQGPDQHRSVGLIAINPIYIGKVKIAGGQTHANRKNYEL
jgi:hypothetical protein